MIDITGIDKADVLAALFNAATPQPGDEYVMPPAKARILIDGHPRKSLVFGEMNGRMLMVDLVDDFDPTAYDAEQGEGAAAAAIDGI